jgi:hypothetical protein
MGHPNGDLASTLGHALTEMDQPILMPGGHRVGKLAKFDREHVQFLTDDTVRHVTIPPALGRASDLRETTCASGFYPHRTSLKHHQFWPV